MATDTNLEVVPEGLIEPFHMIYKNNDQGPTVDIGICVNQPLRDFIMERKIEDAHILVVIRKGKVDIERKLTPLAKGFVRVVFDSAGEYTAHLMVVYPYRYTDLPSWQVWQMLLEKNSAGIFVNSVFKAVPEEEPDEPYEIFECTIKSRRSWLRARINRMPYDSVETIIVKPGNFATPPPAWKNIPTRWFFPDNDRDPCQFRSRFWFRSLELIFTVLPLHYLAKLLGLIVYTLTGFVYNLHPAPALRPYRHGPFRAVFGEVKTKSFWFYKREGEYSFKLRPKWWIVTFVAMLTELALIAILDLSNTEPSLGLNVFWATLFSIVVGGVAVVFWGIALLVISHKETEPKTPSKRQQRRAQRKIDSLEATKRELIALSCDKQGQPITIDDLIKRRRHSPIVVYYRTKDRFCQPYAKH